MAESTIKNLERQLASLQKLYASIETGKFPKAILICGNLSPGELRTSVEQNLNAFGLAIADLENLGLLDRISICHLRWLDGRRVSKSTLPMSGSD